MSATEQCFLCSKLLARPKPKSNHSKSVQSAKIYSDTLIRLFNFDIDEPNENRDRLSKLKLNILENPFATQRQEENDGAAEENINSITKLKLKENLLEVLYCCSCVQIIRKVNMRFRDADKIRQQIIEYRKQIIDLLVKNCDAFVQESAEAEDTNPPISTTHSLRYDIIQGFHLKKAAMPTPQPNFTLGSTVLTSRSPLVHITRLEDVPDIFTQYESVILRKPNNTIDFSEEIKIEPGNEVFVLEMENFEIPEGTEEDADEVDIEVAPLLDLKIENSLRPQNLSLDNTKDKKLTSLATNKRKRRRRRATRTAESAPAPKPSYPCTYEGCDFVHGSWKTTYIHVREVHGPEEVKKEHECDACHKKFARKDSLLTHKKNFHTLWNCSVCSSVLPNLNTLLIHKRDVHNEGFKCSLCPYTATANRHLQVHLHITHQKEKNFVCQHCGLNFSEARRLAYHQGSKHPEFNSGSEVAKVKCGQCNKLYCDPFSLRKHISTVHLRQYKFHCDVCGKGVYNKSALVHHMKSHTGEKPLECQICHAKFLHKKTFDEHKQRHTGEFKYKCKFCSKNFVSSRGLVRHEQIHEGVLRYFCPTCKKGFPVRNYLYMHMRSHETPDEKAERIKRSQEKNLPPLAKLYHELRKKKSTTVSVPMDPNAPHVEEYQMMYDHRRERNTISGFISEEQKESSPLN